jgi:hypothetical protein
MKELTKKTIKKMKKKYGKKLDKKYKKYKKEQKEKAKQEKIQLKMNKRVEEFGYAIDESKILKKLKNDRIHAPCYLMMSIFTTKQMATKKVTTIGGKLPVYHPYSENEKVLLNILESEMKDVYFNHININFIINKNLALHEEFLKLLSDDNKKIEFKITKTYEEGTVPKNEDGIDKIKVKFIETPCNIKVRDPYKLYVVQMGIFGFEAFINAICNDEIPNFLQFTSYSSHSIELHDIRQGKDTLIGYLLNDLPL